MAIRRTQKVVYIDSTDSPYTVPTGGEPIDLIEADTTGGAVEIVLPDAAGGECIRVVRSAGAVNNVTIKHLLVLILTLGTLDASGTLVGKADGSWIKT